MLLDDWRLRRGSPAHREQRHFLFLSAVEEETAFGRLENNLKYMSPHNNIQIITRY